MSRFPIALKAFEELAESFACRIDTKPHNAFYERPATLSLIPEVKDKRVLDAGCGPGVYTEWLVNHGAQVVAVDVSPRMIELAKDRVGSKATILQADIGQPLRRFRDASFDMILSTLVLDYLENWGRMFREFYRLLAWNGYFIFSVGHPFGDFLTYKAGNYFKKELVKPEWKGFGIPVVVPCYRRPLQAILDPLLEAGFVLDRLLEPRPIRKFKQKIPKDYEELSKQPGFLCIRAKKYESLSCRLAKE
jgi:SAM-dependent methyltransferase